MIYNVKDLVLGKILANYYIPEYYYFMYRSLNQNILFFRVGSCFPPISIACYDVYGNRTSFSRVPKVIAKVLTSQDVLFQSEKLKPHLSSQNSVITVEVISLYRFFPCPLLELVLIRFNVFNKLICRSYWLKVPDWM